MTSRLRITEIFLSLQGETSTMGAPTTFVRLTGCPLRCHYCDTAYAFQGGQWMGLSDILCQVQQHGVGHVTVTGGEPLAQPHCALLLTQLCDAGFQVSLETSGAMSIKGLDERVAVILDVKTPGSGEAHRHLLGNYVYLKTIDQIKFVITDRKDYEFARSHIQQHDLSQQAAIWFSPSYEQLAYRQLAEWILQDKLAVRMQLQLHKIIWGDEPGR